MEYSDEGTSSGREKYSVPRKKMKKRLFWQEACEAYRISPRDSASLPSHWQTKLMKGSPKLK